MGPRICACAPPAIRIHGSIGGIPDQQMQVRTARIPSGTADAKHLPMRDQGAAHQRTGLYRDRAHVPVIRVIAIGVMQANVNAEIDPVVLRVPPTSVDDLICIGGGIHGAIGDAVIHPVVTIVIYPFAQAVGPIRARARIADTCLRRRRARRWRRRAVLAGSIASVCQDNGILRVIRHGMVEDRFL